MNQIENFNQIEKFIKKQEAFDNLVKWGLVIFIIMASGIVYYVVNNIKLKKENTQQEYQIKIKDEYIKILEEERRKYAETLSDTIKSINKFYKIQSDSTYAEITKYQKSKDSSIISLQKLINNIKSNSSIQRIQSVERKINENVKKEVKKLEELANDVKRHKQLLIPKYNVYIQYMSSTKELADKAFLAASKISKYSVSKPELIHYDFPTTVKYFHDSDKSEAKIIADKLNIPIKFEKSKHKVKVGYIEVWLGN